MFAESILLISSDERTLDYWSSILTTLNYPLIKTQTYEKSKEVIKRLDKKLLLCLADLDLEDGDVFSLTRISPAPVLVVTPKSTKELSQKCFEEGGFELLEKPIKPEDLISTINKAIGYYKIAKDSFDKKSQLLNLSALSLKLCSDMIVLTTGDRIQDNSLGLLIRRRAEQLGARFWMCHFWETFDGQTGCLWAGPLPGKIKDESLKSQVAKFLDIAFPKRVEADDWLSEKSDWKDENFTLQSYYGWDPETLGDSREFLGVYEEHLKNVLGNLVSPYFHSDQLAPLRHIPQPVFWVRAGSISPLNGDAEKIKRDSPGLFSGLSEKISLEFEEKGRAHFRTKIAFGIQYYEATVISLRMYDYLLILKNIEEIEQFQNRHHDFILRVAHELKTPIASLIQQLDYIQNGSLGDLNDDQREFLDSAIEDARTATGLVDSFKNQTKLALGELEFEPDEVGWNDFTRLVARKSGVFKYDQIEGNFFEEREIKGFSDWEKITIILSNLLSNALKYGGEKVSLEMVEEDSPILKPTNMLFKDYPNPLSNLLFTVKDNGDGIPYQKRDEMFEPFVRFHRGPQAGSGLGLSLARGFARFLGGEIDFVDGNLTTFKFKVPLYSFFKAQIFRTMRLVEKYYRRGLITTMVIFAFEEKRGEPFSIDFYKSLEISSYFQQTLYRTTDYVGFGDNKANFLLLLPGTNAKDSIFAINRMLSVLKGVSGLPSETLLRVGLCEYSPLFKTFKDFLGTARSNEYYYEKLSDLGSSP